MVVAFALAKARHILICSSNITLLFVISTVEGVTFLGTLLFKQQARKNFSPLSLSKGVHGTWFYRANTEKELSVNHEVN